MNSVVFERNRRRLKSDVVPSENLPIKSCTKKRVDRDVRGDRRKRRWLVLSHFHVLKLQSALYFSFHCSLQAIENTICNEPPVNISIENTQYETNAADKRR